MQLYEYSENMEKIMPNYEYNKKYAEKQNEGQTETITVRFYKNECEKIKQYCKLHNISMSSLIKNRLKDIIE